jgi:WD40 repeat protein/serine/threonine protein kinase
MHRELESDADGSILDGVLADYMRRVDRGEQIDRDAFIAAHSELAGELRAHFSQVAAVERVAVGGQAAERLSGLETETFGKADLDTGRGRLEVRCPNCHQPTRVAVDTTLTDLTCSACGSHFSLVDEKDATQHAPTLAKLGRFELTSLLGMGAFGAVWKARDKELDRTVAIKIPRHGAMTPEDQEKFFREARAAAQLRHPSIVSVHEVGRDGDSVYIVSDFVRGVTLGDWLTGQKLTSREAAELCAKIADALHHAHEQGVFHRDLKPANIMIDGDGQPLLMDFGLARREVGEVTVTMDGHILGTPAYMSPEQAEGQSHAADGRSDVYSLGVILFQLLTGELPFRGNARMLMHQVIHDEPPSPRKLNGNVPKDLETITLKCLEKDPSRRYLSAHDVSEEFHRYLSGHPICARPISRIAQAWRWAKRRPAVAALLGTVAIFAVVGPVVAVQQATLRLRLAEKTNTLQHQLVQNVIERGAGRAEASDIREAVTLFAHAYAIARPDDPLRSSARYLVAGWSANLAACTLMHDSSVEELAFSPDGRTVLTGSTDNTARLWDAATGKPIGEPLRYKGLISAVAFSPDGRTAFTGSSTLPLPGVSDELARLWNVDTGKPIGEPLRHKYAVNAVAFNPDGRTVLTGSDEFARLWDAVTGRPIGEPLHHEGGVSAVAFSPDGRTALTGSKDKTARLWDLSTGKPVGEPLRHNEGVNAVAFSPDGRIVLTGSQDDTARLWDAATGKPIGEPLPHVYSVTAVAFSPDGRTVLTGSQDRTARLWDAATGKPISEPLRHEGRVTAVAFSPDGRIVLTASQDRTARLWDVAKGKPVGGPLHHEATVTAVAFGPDGHTVLTGSGDMTARLWNTNRGRPVGEFLGHEGRVTDMAFSPDGRTVLTGSTDNTARLWDAATGKPIGEPLRHENAVNAVAFSPDGHTVLAGIGETARLWDAATRKPIGELLGHTQSLTAVAFSPDGGTILTGSVDITARLWDAATGKQIGEPLRHRSSSGGVSRIQSRRPHSAHGIFQDRAAMGYRHEKTGRHAAAA